MARARDIVGEAVTDAARTLDTGSVQALYAAVSVSVSWERQRLRRGHRVFVDPDASRAPDPAAVARTARWLIAQATWKATVLGGAAGLGGLASVPPEVMGQLIGILRLGQRLAIVYGFDPSTERGGMALRQALSAGLGIDIPEGGPLGLAASDLPRILAGSAPTEVSVAMTRALVRQSAWLVVGSVARFVPGLAVGAGAWRARSTMREVGERMRASLSRAAGLPDVDAPDVVEAVEVPRSAS